MSTSTYLGVIVEKNGKNHMISLVQARMCSSASALMVENLTLTDGKEKAANTCIQTKHALA